MKDYTNFNEDNQKEAKLTFDIEEPNYNEKSLVNKMKKIFIQNAL